MPIATLIGLGVSAVTTGVKQSSGTVGSIQERIAAYEDYKSSGATPTMIGNTGNTPKLTVTTISGIPPLAWMVVIGLFVIGLAKR